MIVTLLAYVALCYALAFWPERVLYFAPIAKLLSRSDHYTCITLGGLHFVWSPDYVPGAVFYLHEGTHTRQWRRWGPVFPPLYLYYEFRYGYSKNPFEQAARAAAGEPLQ